LRIDFRIKLIIIGYLFLREEKSFVIIPITTAKGSKLVDESMPEIWLDTVTPKISIAINSMLPVLHKKGYSTLVTAKKQTQTTDMLDALKVPYQRIGDYGETLKEKLVEEQKRTLEFVDLFEKVGYPKVLWTHGDVSAIRTAFGLGIPIVYANDTVFAYAVARLACPLVNWLVTPISFGKSWSKFGISKSKIIHYDGLEEAAWFKDTKFEKPKFLEELKDKKPVILFRDAEYQAVYCKDVKVDSQKLLEKLTKLGTVVCLPRYEKEKEQYRGLDNIWVSPEPVLTAQIIPYIDLMVGSGGTACRETAMCGIPTINFHFWDVQARYLYEKGFPVQIIRRTDKIIKTAKKILQNPEKHKINTKAALDRIESPVPTWVHYIELGLKTKPS
jgi:predicted glycosyltransferase